MSDYTPTTSEVREDFAYPMEGFYQDRPARLAAFDRWLANERAEAYDEGYAANGQPTLVGELPIEYDHDNPYREET